MGYFNSRLAWRAIVLACALAWFGPAADLKAGPLISPGTLELVRKSVEPFGLFATRLRAGGLAEKWQGVERKLEDDMVQLALCDGDREHCVSPAALQFLAIVDMARTREGRARFGEINRAINLAIRATSDMAQYGRIDVWSPPLDTFASRAGDWLVASGSKHGIAGPFVLSGWSAGGQLTAMGLSHPSVKAGLALSGVFELAPVKETYLNEKLQLTAEDIATCSPTRLPGVMKPMAIADGSLELRAAVEDSR